VELHIDDATMDPLPAIRAWLRGATVCVPASPPLEDVRRWLEFEGFDTTNFVLYRNTGCRAYYDIAMEGQRIAESRVERRRPLSKILDAAAKSAKSLAKL
jgi:hypothetical protein